MVAPTAGLEPVNTRFLDYAPHPASMAFAAGIDKRQCRLGRIGKAIGMIGGFTLLRFLTNRYFLFLKEIDGTISIVGHSRPTEHPGSVDISTTRFIIMAHNGSGERTQSHRHSRKHIYVRLDSLSTKLPTDRCLALRQHTSACRLHRRLSYDFQLRPHKSSPRHNLSTQ